MTIDLNGSIALRAKPAEKENAKAKPTEVVLTNSQWTGDPIRITTNRTYLQRAMKLGLSDLSLYSDASALLCQSFDRKLVWMPLGPEAAIEPAEDVVRIESPKGEVVAPISQSVTPMKVPPMSEPTTTNLPSQAKTDATAPTPAKTSRRKASQQDLAALIDQAVEFRTALHNLVQQSSGLVKALKQHRRQNKAIQNTLASLKQLKTLGV